MTEERKTLVNIIYEFGSDKYIMSENAAHALCYGLQKTIRQDLKLNM